MKKGRSGLSYLKKHRQKPVKYLPTTTYDYQLKYIDNLFSQSKISIDYSSMFTSGNVYLTYNSNTTNGLQPYVFQSTLGYVEIPRNAKSSHNGPPPDMSAITDGLMKLAAP